MVLFFFLFFRFSYKSLKTSDETYGSFRVEVLHDERGKLIKCREFLIKNIFLIKINLLDTVNYLKNVKTICMLNFSSYY